jgi:hypothetical protein
MARGKGGYDISVTVIGGEGRKMTTTVLHIVGSQKVIKIFGIGIR